MSRIHFDHIAIATHRMADAPAVLVGALGGTPTGDGGPSGAYTWGHWRFAGGGRLEILEPLGADGFLHRFLATRGPGIHHVTFRVPSLAEACERAVAHGLRIVGRDESDPAWAEAFLHPKEALGLVVQLAESRVAEMRRRSSRRRARPSRRRRSPCWGCAPARARPSGRTRCGAPSCRVTVPRRPARSSIAGRARRCASPSSSTPVPTRAPSPSSWPPTAPVGLAETLHPVLGTVFRRSEA